MRREDLFSSSTSPICSSPHEQLEIQQAEKLLPLNFLDPTLATKLHSSCVSEDVKEDNDGFFQFHLFSKTSSQLSVLEPLLNPPSRVDIRSPPPFDGNSGFIQPRRSNDFYFTAEPNAEQSKRFRDVAVSGEAILAEQHQRWVFKSLSAPPFTINI